MKFPVKVKFYVEGKLNKWLRDEDLAWRDLTFHTKKTKMERLISKEMTKNAFGLLITDLSHVVSNAKHLQDKPLSRVKETRIKLIQYDEIKQSLCEPLNFILHLLLISIHLPSYSVL